MSEFIAKCSEVVGISGKALIVPEYIDTSKEIVRCRDCIYGMHFFHHDDERWQCTNPYQDCDNVKPDAYCWRGERKEGGDD